jgi:hypothetical protein
MSIIGNQHPTIQASGISSPNKTSLHIKKYTDHLGLAHVLTLPRQRSTRHLRSKGSFNYSSPRISNISWKPSLPFFFGFFNFAGVPALSVD